ncbi:MAG: E2/UBC family protein [Vulcanimicrobiota bacterium]
MRRQFDLLPNDETFLNDYGLPWESVLDGSRWVLIHDFPLPPGYTVRKATAAIRIETGYPNVELNMVYFHPRIAREDQQRIGATDAQQVIESKTYQRWSRHRSKQNPWRIGFDSLETHIILVEDWLERELLK